MSTGARPAAPNAPRVRGSPPGRRGRTATAAAAGRPRKPPWRRWSPCPTFLNVEAITKRPRARSARPTQGRVITAASARRGNPRPYSQRRRRGQRRRPSPRRASPRRAIARLRRPVMNREASGKWLDLAPIRRPSSPVSPFQSEASKTDPGRRRPARKLQEARSAAGWMVTLSPQPQASVWLGLRKTNFDDSRLTS